MEEFRLILEAFAIGLIICTVLLLPYRDRYEQEEEDE